MMITISTIFTGINAADALFVCYDRLKEYRAGRDTLLTILFQTVLIDGTWTDAQKAYKTPLPLSLYRIIMLTPLCLGVLSTQQFQNHHTKKFVEYTHQYISQVAVAISAISFVALIASGSVLYSTSAFLWIGFRISNTTQILPQHIRSYVAHIGVRISQISNLLFGRLFFKIEAAATLINDLWERFSSATQQTLQEETRKQQNSIVTIDNLKEIRMSEFEVDRSHVHSRFLPALSDASIDPSKVLTAIFSNEVDWKEYDELLCARLNADERWNNRLNMEQKPLAYIEEQLNIMVDEIMNEKIRDGEPQDYRLLQYYLKYIASQLPQQDSRTKAEVFVHLTAQGGTYCGTGKFRAVYDMFVKLRFNQGEATLEQRICAILESVRHTCFDRVINVLATNDFLRKHLIGRLHIRNMLVAATGRDLGLQGDGAEHELRETPKIYISLSNIISRIFQRRFWQLYDSDEILQAIGDSIGTPSLPRQELFLWWKNWLQAQKEAVLEPDSKRAKQLAILEELLEGGRFDPASPRNIGAMLYHLGILKIETAVS